MEGDRQMPHSVILEGRERLEISGVTEVRRYDERQISLSTVAGEMVIRGRDLKMGEMSCRSGEMQVQGRVDEIVYADETRSGKGFWARLVG